MNKQVLGWDIGGAHLKAILLDGNGMVQQALQVPCPLWRGVAELEAAIAKILQHMPTSKALHAVTMTGELADIFSDRHAGVLQIAQVVQQRLQGAIMFYTANGFVKADAVEKHSAEIASMNWLASAEYLATQVPQALLLDIGSTTTDIVLISNGKPSVQGMTDAERMRHDELVYTGVVRTPLMALAHKIPFTGHRVNVAAEHFATTADIYTLTGDLAAENNLAETADGTEKSLQASARRIARMVGHDAKDAPLSAWRDLALAFKQAQLNLIKQAVSHRLSLLGECHNLQILGAGAGDFLAEELAQQLNLKYQSVKQWITAQDDNTRNMATVCFPAYAVASLAVSLQSAQN